MKKLFFSLALLSSAAVFASEGQQQDFSASSEVTEVFHDASSEKVSSTTEDATTEETTTKTTRDVKKEEASVDNDKVVGKTFVQKTKDFVRGNKVALGSAAAVAVVATAIYLYNQHVQEVESFETPAF